jgi:dihydroorotase
MSLRCTVSTQRHFEVSDSMDTAPFDLVIQSPRIVCVDSQFDGPGSVAIRDGRIAALGTQIEGSSCRTIQSEGMLLPGLIDLHAHPARGGSKYGVDPDQHFLPDGVTTVLSQGDAGADDWPAYRNETIARSSTRVQLAINLSRRGESMPGGCFAELEWADVEACLAAIADGGDRIWGIAANVSEIACERTDPRAVMQRAIRVREESGMPLLYGIHVPRGWSLDGQMPLLKAGDVVTYCFRGGEHCIVGADGRVHSAVRDARERGVLFDVGHGMGSFSFAVAEAAIADGFPPDTISTDKYARHIGLVPAHTLPRTMAKLRAAGMSERDVLTAATSRPARVLGLANEVGTLRPGASADITVLLPDDSAPLTDVEGRTRPGGAWRAALVVRAGRVVGGA